MTHMEHRRRLPSWIRRALTSLIGVALFATPVGAQRTGAGGERAALERRFRERFATLVRDRLHLSGEQMRRLAEVHREHDERRRLLHSQERDARMALREEVLAGDRADQARVAELVARVLRLQHERIDLIEAEQERLATFLTPVQRARYLAMQDQLRKRMDEMRRRRAQERPRAPRSGLP